MDLQLARDAVHVLLRLAVARAERFGALLRLAEQTADALLFRLVQRFQLHQQPGEHRADLAHVAHFDLIERRLRKIGDVFLRRRAVLDDNVRVAQVDLPGKIRHRLLLRLGEVGKLRTCLGCGLLELGLGLYLRGGRLVQIGGQGELGDLLFIHDVILLYFVSKSRPPLSPSAAIIFSMT